VKFTSEILQLKFTSVILQVKFYKWNFTSEILQVKFYKWNFTSEILQVKFLSEILQALLAQPQSKCLHLLEKILSRLTA
jgi:hypothetical protein